MQSLMTKCHRGPREGDMEDAANKSAPVSLDGQVIHLGDQTVLELTLSALPGFWELRPLSWETSNRHNVPLFMA